MTLAYQGFRGRPGALESADVGLEPSTGSKYQIQTKALSDKACSAHATC
jgi:hypothetical protein